MIIIDELINQKLATYYNGNNISNSLKSMIHIETIYKIQLPNGVWKLIKEFMIYGKDECILATKFYQSKEPYIIHQGKFFTIPSVFNNYTLTELHLENNEIKDISTLANALNTNSTLTYLNLSDNQITDVTALGNALNTNSTLTELRLYHNPITDITALGNALHTNSTLDYLYLGGNQITDNDKSLIRQAWGNRSCKFSL